MADQADARPKTQLSIAPEANRLTAYRSITAAHARHRLRKTTWCCPPHLGREVADAIPNGRYLEIPDTGHLGFIEKPQVVNAAALKFFADSL